MPCELLSADCPQARSTASSLDKTLPEVVRVFTSADGILFAATYNQLNAYFATIPGNYQHNLRRLYLLNSNYADLSFLFTILPGERQNEHLDAEYLAVLETDHATPYFLIFTTAMSPTR